MLTTASKAAFNLEKGHLGGGGEHLQRDKIYPFATILRLTSTDLLKSKHQPPDCCYFKSLAKFQGSEGGG